MMSTKSEMQGPEVRWLVHIMVPLDQYATPDEVKKAREPLEKIRSLRPAEFEKRARTRGRRPGICHARSAPPYP